MSAEITLRASGAAPRTDSEFVRTLGARADGVRVTDRETATHDGQREVFGDRIAEARETAERQQAARRSGTGCADDASQEHARDAERGDPGRSAQVRPGPGAARASAPTRPAATAGATRHDPALAETGQASDAPTQSPVAADDGAVQASTTAPQSEVAAPATDHDAAPKILEPVITATPGGPAAAPVDAASAHTASTAGIDAANVVHGPDTGNAAHAGSAAGASAGPSAGNAAAPIAVAGDGCAEDACAANSADVARTSEGVQNAASASRLVGDSASRTAQAGGAFDAPLTQVSGLGAASGATIAGSPSTTIHSATLPTPIGHPAFPERFAADITLLTTAGIERAEISVQPRDLGPVRIELSLNGEVAQIAFAATQPDTRQAIEQSLPILKDMLARHGILLSDASVSDGQPDDRAGSGSGSAQASRHAKDQGYAGDGGVARAGTLRSATAARGLLDLYA